MDDVIIIDDSPPSSPAPPIVTNHPKKKRPHKLHIDKALLWEKENSSYFHNSMSLTPSELKAMSHKPVSEHRQLYDRKRENYVNVDPYRSSFVRFEDGRILCIYDTPITIDDCDDKPDSCDSATMEFVDVNNMSYCPSETVKAETSERDSVTAPAKILNQPNKMKFNGVNGGVVTSSATYNDKYNGISIVDEDDDVIYVGAFPNNDKPRQQPTKAQKLATAHDTTKKNGFTNVVSQHVTLGEKRKQITARRSGKRQEEDKVLWKAKEDPSYQPKTAKALTQRKSAGKENKETKQSEQKSLRRSQRQKLNCGAVLRTPSPLRSHHFRTWPVEGMNERPEYNPVTGKINKFDYTIRQISEAYGMEQKVEDDSILIEIDDIIDKIEEPLEVVQQKETKLPTLTHEVLHAALAYVATSKAQPNSTNDKEQKEKLEFFTNFGLQERSQTEIAKDKIEEISRNKDTLAFFQQELLENCVLLYCLANNIHQNDVSEYINTLDKEACVKWFYEQLKREQLPK